MNFRAKQIYFVIFALALLALAACGPAGAGAALTNNNGVAEESDGEPGETVLTRSEPHFAVAPNSEEITADGIRVGFTAEGQPFMGDPAAPILMEEYSDFQCPFCSRFFNQTLPSLKENQIASGDVVLVYYDFPLMRIHPQAMGAHQAGRCVAESGARAFWEMHDLLFENIDEWSGQANTTPIFATYAEEVGVDVEEFITCMDEAVYESAVMADLNGGIQRGINSTPSFFLNDSLVAGAQPLSVFEQAINTLLSGGQLATAPTQQQAAAVPTPAALNDNVAARLGNPDAPVTIVEFTDYQCPYCSQHATDTMDQIVQELVETGRVQYILKDFPLDNLHPEARLGAVAARCAGEQDAYWEMHHALFANQQLWSGAGPEVAEDGLATLAQQLGLNVRDFNACIASGRHDAAVEANYQEGSSLGVTGTPAFFIDGYPLVGARPYEVFEYAVGLAQNGQLAQAYAQPTQPQAQPTPAGPVDVPLDDVAFSIGDPNAPVTIVEYTDYQCPYCGRHFQQTYPQILEQYVETGQVRYVFKDFPLTSIHPQAYAAAEAARCAGDQGAYLEMHDMLFSRQNEWNGRNNTTEIFTGYAAELDLDTNTFSSCMETRKYEEAVAADLQEGVGFGVRGTPAFFINGHILSGAQPFSTFQQAIEQVSNSGNSN